MNFLTMPSLEHMALVKISTTLWNSVDVKERIKNFNIRINNEEMMRNWLRMESSVKMKVDNLSLLHECVFTEKNQKCH